MKSHRLLSFIAASLFSVSLFCGCSGGAVEDSSVPDTSEPEEADVAAEVEMPEDSPAP